MLCLTLAAVACTRGPTDEPVDLPNVAPDTVVMAWSVTSRTSDRDSLHVVLEADRTLVVTNRTADGTMMSVSRTVPEEEYANLVRTLRTLNCCSLQSSKGARPSPVEAKPMLEINLGDVQCVIERWDSEWREGLARRCGFTVARFHGGGFVPDPPVDETRP